jgi:adenylate kinase
MTPIVDNVCDKCGTTLSKRSDDNAEVFENRYETYLRQTAPVIDYLKTKHQINYVNSGINREYTFEQIENILAKENNLSNQIKK